MVESIPREFLFCFSNPWLEQGEGRLQVKACGRDIPMSYMLLLTIFGENLVRVDIRVHKRVSDVDKLGSYVLSLIGRA